MTVTKPRWAMALDLERCIGCHACSVACKVENEIELGVFRTKVYYYDHGTFPARKRSFLPTLCMHCEDAPCVQACPTDSIKRADNGIVGINVNTCSSVGKCIEACPYGAIHIDPVHHVADKCDFCSHRLDVGLQPACVEACPAQVFAFGDLNDPASDIVQFRQRHGTQLQGLKEQKGTRPQVQYRGIGTAVPTEIVQKIPDGKSHDPTSYEIDTWDQL